MKSLMRLSIFTTCTRPYDRGDLIDEALACYKELADEVVVNDRNWPMEFTWPHIGKSFQQGYEAATGDWAIRADLDYIFHEQDFGKIRQALKQYPNTPAISFYKWQFILPDRYNLKSRVLIAMNKAKFGDRIKLNGGGDLCQPTLDGRELKLNEMPEVGVPVYNYEKMTKTKAQIMEDQGRMDRAWHRHFGGYQLSEDGSNESAYEGWLKMVVGRFNKPSEHIKIKDHPKYIQETIKNLKPEQWGYSGFGNLPENNYVQSLKHSR
jgi:hypothetical protein